LSLAPALGVTKFINMMLVTSSTGPHVHKKDKELFLLVSMDKFEEKQRYLNKHFNVAANSAEIFEACLTLVVSQK
jgi:hypothetical protein